MVSNPDIAALLAIFDEPLRGANERALPAAQPAGERLAQPPGPAPTPLAADVPKKGGSAIKVLLTALAGIALVPMAILFGLLWQDMMRQRATHRLVSAEPVSAASLHRENGTVQPKQTARPLEVALSSPDRIEAGAGVSLAFPITIDATDALPARSIVAISALPEGASFSAGRPYGAGGWSLRPDEIGDVQLQLPAEGGAFTIRLELIAGDGTVLARSETQVVALPPVVASVDIPMLDAPQPAASNIAASQQVAEATETAQRSDAPPLPQRNPSSPAAAPDAVKVNKVKVVTIAPPRPARPHDGAYALGSPADEPQGTGEWMVTKTAVDMHAKAEQSSETVKVAQGGVKMRVLARDKRWVQVTDPATSTTGWIYDRFLAPAEAPAQ